MFQIKTKKHGGSKILLSWLIIQICFPLFTHQAFADRSELGLGLQVNAGQMLSKQGFDSNLGSFTSAEQPAWSHSSQLLQIGLGLNFSSSLWLKFGLTQTQALMKHSEDSYMCTNKPQANSGSLKQADCAQLMSEFSNKAFQSIIAYNYKPFDDLSPFFELSVGIGYLPKSEFWTYIERSSLDQDQNDWTRTNLGLKAKREAIISWDSRLSFGFEKRIVSHWGVRISTWFLNGLSNSNAENNLLSYGLSLDILYYRYIRLM